MFDWLLCYMLKISHQKLENSLKAGKDLFTARNDNQIFYSKTLAIIFIEVSKPTTTTKFNYLYINLFRSLLAQNFNSNFPKDDENKNLRHLWFLFLNYE